jgi:hypothetical protein
MTQFLRDQGSDSEEVVTALMLDGTYLSRNFATLGPSHWQPPCDSMAVRKREPRVQGIKVPDSGVQALDVLSTGSWTHDRVLLFLPWRSLSDSESTAKKKKKEREKKRTGSGSTLWKKRSRSYLVFQYNFILKIMFSWNYILYYYNWLAIRLLLLSLCQPMYTAYDWGFIR